MIRNWRFVRVIAIISLLAGGTGAQQAPAPDPSAEPQTTVLPTPSPGENSVIDDLENALKQREEKQQAEVLADPTKPRTHRFTNQPVGTVLRVLAEEAELNYVEPGINSEERISVVLTNMTPVQAFYAVAGARGFKIVSERDTNVVTLRRSDINAPSYYEVRRYTLRYQGAEDLKQAVAGYLGIQVKPVAGTNPAYPPTANGQGGAAAYAGAPEVTGGAGGGIQTLYSAGTEQSAPRFVSGLPFDNPLSAGGVGENKVIWSGSNARLIRSWSTPRPKNTKVWRNRLRYGIDRKTRFKSTPTWSKSTTVTTFSVAWIGAIRSGRMALRSP